MGLFKTSNELLEKGQDLVKQKEFAKAQAAFQKSAEKASRDGDNDLVALSNVLGNIMGLQSGYNQGNFGRLFQSLQPLGEGELRVGIKSIKASTLALEANITANELGIQNIPQNVEGLMQRAQMLQNVGVRYQTQIGNSLLFLPELFGNQNETGIQKALKLFAASQENMAEAIVGEDPKRAAEYYQNAVNYWKQVGMPQAEQNDLIRVAQYSKSASCWFCGREITGECVHFFQMGAELTKLLKTTKSESPLPSFDPSTDRVYACRGCHSAISIKADEIALGYYNNAMARLAEVNQNLQSQINELRRMAHHH